MELQKSKKFVKPISHALGKRTMLEYLLSHHLACLVTPPQASMREYRVLTSLKRCMECVLEQEKGNFIIDPPILS